MKQPETYKTTQARATTDSLVKPGELVDLVELTPLTLADRRIYNQLLEHAWDAIEKPVTHVISKSSLRGSHNSNDRVGDSIERLMSAVVKIRTTKDGEPAIERVQLLGGNIETERRDGILEFEIPARLRKIIKNSTIFARLQREVMFALGSKYALTLYEMVQKRGNLKYKASERFSIKELRGILGVPDGKLSTWSNLKNRAIDPSVSEVNELSDYIVEMSPIKTGRSVTHVEMKWWPKDSNSKSITERELSFSKVGRKERAKERAGQGENFGVSLKPRPAWLERMGTSLRTDTYETARLRYNGYDIYNVESEWRAWSKGKEPAKDPDRAFLAFFKKFAEANPLI